MSKKTDAASARAVERTSKSFLSRVFDPFGFEETEPPMAEIERLAESSFGLNEYRDRFDAVHRVFFERGGEDAKRVEQMWNDRNLCAIAHAEAAYAVGLEVGRRLSGGAR